MNSHQRRIARRAARGWFRMRSRISETLRVYPGIIEKLPNRWEQERQDSMAWFVEQVLGHKLHWPQRKILQALDDGSLFSRLHQRPHPVKLYGMDVAISEAAETDIYLIPRDVDWRESENWAYLGKIKDLSFKRESGD